MNFPRWRQSLVRSLHLHRSKPEAKYFQIASISSGTQVKNRTMVFRGFIEDSLDILAVTDSRSEKIQDWHANPHSEICWYFAKSKEQYRISVNVELYRNETDHLRQKTWQQLSTNAKSQFYWPSPKAPFDNNGLHLFDSDSLKKGRNLTANEKIDVPDSFVVVRFIPIQVDYLNLSDTPQTREIHQCRSRTWEYTKVNP